MTEVRRFMVGVAALVMGVSTIHAQVVTSNTKEASGKAQVTTSKIVGEVVKVGDGTLAVKVQPKGEIETFAIRSGQQFTIDGQLKHLADLKPGTILNATVTTTTQPVTVRTVTVTNGTVWFVSGNTVILTLDTGENHQYMVPDGFQFMVDGKATGVTGLRAGVKVSGTKVVEAPTYEIYTKAVITGKAPK